MNVAVYRAEVIDRFIANLQTVCEFKGLDYHQQIFQQDGATAHTGKENLQYLEQHLPSTLISRYAALPYPPRSPDLTPLDSHLWGIVNANCFSDPKPRTIEQLKLNVEDVISSISNASLHAMTDNIRQMMELCLAQDGAHIEHVMH